MDIVSLSSIRKGLIEASAFTFTGPVLARITLAKWDMRQLAEITVLQTTPCASRLAVSFCNGEHVEMWMRQQDVEALEQQVGGAQYLKKLGEPLGDPDKPARITTSFPVLLFLALYVVVTLLGVLLAPMGDIGAMVVMAGHLGWWAMSYHFVRYLWWASFQARKGVTICGCLFVPPAIR
jgi:hypothetical protein